MVRYPNDPYDRAWLPWTDSLNEFSNVSTTEKVKENIGNLRMHAPSVVMQTAITSRSDSGSKSINFTRYTQPNHVYPVPGYTVTP